MGRKNPHDTPEWKQGTRTTLDPIAERVSWDDQRRPIDTTKIPITESHTESCKKIYLDITQYKHVNREKRAKIGGRISRKTSGGRWH